MSDADFGLGWGEEGESTTTAETLTTVDAEREERRQAQAQLIAERVEAAVEAAKPGLGKIPDPLEPAGDGDLTDEERARLATCVEGVDLLSTAHYIAGKSLDTIAVGRLFRKLPHKLEPERCYRTIEEWAWVEKGVTQTRCSKLRAAWELGEVLAARGYDAPEGQVREIVPVKNAHGLNAAVGVYELVVQSVGADAVTAERLREVVKMLPGDLAISDEDPEQIAQTLKGVLVSGGTDTASRAVPPELRRNVDRRGIALADRLGRGKIPRPELMQLILQAFTADEDVFEAVLKQARRANH